VIGPTGSARSTRRSTWVIGATRAAGPTVGSARAAWSAGATGTARIAGCVRRMYTAGSRPTMNAGRTGRWRSGSGVGGTQTHAERCGAQSARDGYPPK
jgi:hypothetical protein